jgi:hypothetical protein
MNANDLVEVWQTMSVAAIAEKFGTTQQAVYATARRIGLPGRREMPVPQNDIPGEDDPTPEQIAERAAAIRKTWADSEHERRWMGPRRIRYEFPTYRSEQLFGQSETPVFSRV